MLFDLVTKKLAEFDTTRQTINDNQNLSPAGKKTEMQRINLAYLEYEPKAYEILRDDMTNLRKAFKTNETARADATQAAAATWDYSRLNYASQAVQQAVTKIQRSADPLRGILPEQAAREEWNRARYSGDKHTQRAWAEFGAPALESAYPTNHDVAVLAAEMRKALPALLSTPALQAVDKRGEELAGVALQLVEAIKKADEAYTPPNPFQDSKYQALLHGVKVEKVYLGEAGFMTTVTIDDYPTEGLIDTFSKAGLA